MINYNSSILLRNLYSKNTHLFGRDLREGISFRVFMSIERSLHRRLASITLDPVLEKRGW